MHEKRFNRAIERLRDPERLARLEVNRVIDLVLAKMGENLAVLDVGTGSGVFAEQFAARGHQVSGVDANPEMAAAFQTYVPKGTFKLGVAEEMPFADRSFDLVFMGLLLHETDDTQKAVNESFRVTRRRLAVLEWPCEEQPFGPPMPERFTEVAMRKMGQRAGFKKIKATRLKNLMLYLFEQ